MNWSKPQLWIAVVSTLAVIGVAVVDSGRTAPGPLSAVHDREERLAGRRDCSECHGSWRRSMASACLECHVELEQQVAAGGGLHGTLSEDVLQECASCHSEHHGAGFAIINRQSFAGAGVADPDQFDHATLGFLLDGAHLALDCTQCHTHSADVLPPPGARRYMGLERDCASCHEDPHAGRMQPACAACHGQDDFTQLRSEGHAAYLPLVGGHADSDCRSCHVADSPHALEAMGAGRQVAPRACQDCHAAPHAGAFVNGVARQEGLAAAAACVVCHLAQHTRFDADDVTVSARQHAAAGFPLDRPHADVDCSACHASDAGEFAARYPGRDADTCSACHADPHGGQFAESPFLAEDCLGCHARDHFEPASFGVEQHASAAFALEGSHSELACNECHQRESGSAPRTFRGTPARCEACHNDVHDGTFQRHEPRLSSTPQGTCAACHRTTTFADAAQEGFDHSRWTDFVLEGAHKQSLCESCHQRTHEPDESGRRFGRVEDSFGAVQGCVSCHADPHAGRFDVPGAPLSVEGASGCARCHSEVSFRSVTSTFDHLRWTGFGLDGSHQALDCSACHAPQPRADGRGLGWGQAAGKACNDCHADPHGGQFQAAGVGDCARCHTSDSSFEGLVFDHEKGARFALGEAHAAVACSACHPKTRYSDGIERVRYRPVQMECADCHGVQERPLLRRGGRGK